jgi:hypothetical protein
MRRAERAMQLWSLLVMAARNQQLLSYSTVGQITGIPRQDFDRILEAILNHCERNNLPPITALIYRDEIVILEQKAKDATVNIFSFDWLNHPAPSPSDFEFKKSTHMMPGNSRSRFVTSDWGSGRRA